MIYYEDFGAVGDGVTNDFEAIFRAHEAANLRGEAVSATPGKVYYIRETGMRSAIIKTDVSWRGASFIIDDSEMPNCTYSDDSKHDIFRIESDFALSVLTENDSDAIKRINESCGIDSASVTRLDLGLGYPALLMVYDETKPFYIRYGFGSSSPQRELCVVDKNGFIKPETRFLFDYTRVTKIEVYRTDDKPITIEGGSFITKAPRGQNEAGGYRTISRGIFVGRSNVTLRGISHSLEGEIPNGKVVNGVPFYTVGYYGFYKFFHADNVELRDSVASSHVTYCASYDLITHDSNDVRFINVKEPQKTFEDDKRWGIMGSNFCKNLTYDGCYLSRFDAHAGVYNAKILNSTVACLRLTGGGEFYMENSTLKAKAYGKNLFAMLREDFGSTWRGTIHLKDCTFDSTNDSLEIEEVNLIWCQWVNHDFGYEARLPKLVIDNFKVAPRLKTKTVNIFQIYNHDPNLTDVKDFSRADFDGEENKNVYVAPESVTIKNCSAGIVFKLPEGDFFKKTKIIKESL